MLEQGKKKRVVACAFDWPGLGPQCPDGSGRAGIRDHHARGEPARSWALPFLIRRCAWHMLDHAWELQDRDLTDQLAAQ